MNNLMTLKHIEFWEEEVEKIKEFIPRVPSKTTLGEDKSIPRICTSTTIENCVKASPQTSYVLFGMLDEINLMEMSHQYFHYFLETAQYGMLVRVYHFEVEESIVRLPNEIHKAGWVPDALITDEHWLLEKVKPVRTSYAIVRRDESKRYSVEIVQEADSLEELGVFINCEILDHYLMLNRHENTSEIEKPKTYKEALLFKKKCEDEFEKNTTLLEKELEFSKTESFQPYTGDLDDSHLPF